MTTLLLAAAAAVLFQQQPAPQQHQPRNYAPPAQGSQIASRMSRASNPLDSTIGMVADIGVKVGEMRSSYDALRLAAYNGADGAVVERAQTFGGSCQAVASLARTGQRVLCRSCMTTRAMQSAVNDYRAVLPVLERAAQRCADRMRQVNADRVVVTQVTALRRDVEPQGNQMIEALRQYETRVAALRRVMGWEAGPTPRRS